MPAPAISQAVSWAPWLRGRVSSTQTWIGMPASIAWYIGDVAVDLQPVHADHAVGLDILVADPRGLGEGGRGALGLGQAREGAAHLVERPAEVYRGWPGRVQYVVGFGQGAVRRIAFHLSRDTVSRRRADERRAPHPHVADRGGEVCKAVERGDRKIMRQPALVDDPDLAAFGVAPDGPVVGVANLHAKSPVCLARAMSSTLSMSVIVRRSRTRSRPSLRLRSSSGARASGSSILSNSATWARPRMRRCISTPAKPSRSVKISARSSSRAISEASAWPWSS